MPAAVILLAAVCIAVIILGNNHYVAASVLRRLIKPIGKFPRGYDRVRVITDLDYGSAYGGGLDVYFAQPTAPQPILLWVHGGGYVGGDKSYVKSWAPIVAQHGKLTVVSVNYRLAPQGRYPTPLIQINEALRFLAANAQKLSIDFSKIFLGGDSAGAQISSQYAALVYSDRLKKKMNLLPAIGKSQLKGIILYCGFYNADTVLESRFPAIKTFTSCYVGKKISRYGRRGELSTVKNLGEGYCDTFIICGGSDPFLGQAYEMIDALAANGIDTEFYLPQGRRHEFMFNTATAEADTALRKTVEFIDKRK